MNSKIMQCCNLTFWLLTDQKMWQRYSLAKALAGAVWTSPISALAVCAIAAKIKKEHSVA